MTYELAMQELEAAYALCFLSCLATSVSTSNLRVSSAT